MPRPSPLLFVTLATALVISWSSGFVGIRFATDSATVPQILFGRSIFSGLTLLPLALLRGPRITFRAVAEQGLYAFMGMFLYLGGFAVAIGRGVPTGLVALMADLVPLGIAVLSAPILGQALSGRQWLGTVIALGGVLLVSADALALGDAPPLAYALPILGMLAFDPRPDVVQANAAPRSAGPSRSVLCQMQCLVGGCVCSHPGSRAKGPVRWPCSIDLDRHGCAVHAGPNGHGLAGRAGDLWRLADLARFLRLYPPTMASATPNCPLPSPSIVGLGQLFPRRTPTRPGCWRRGSVRWAGCRWSRQAGSGRRSLRRTGQCVVGRHLLRPPTVATGN